MYPAEPIHTQLVGARQQAQPIMLQEFPSNVLPKRKCGAPSRQAPACTVIGVSPEKIAQRAFAWGRFKSVQGPDVIQGVERGGEPGVHTEHLAFHDGSQ
eukprot:CAMPEP_0172872922 /NCGR_PEP_ID=MMETSP1075-20121228/93574_1 /TAXON_ID=2916 /ORGANISM="Ceratium fusus, Strain PA161109" /LENGTH=98 /DNA_ID=CAMNT_0013723333 /DNA_START=26 /DNA_END=319 /DNA_ORIENTATION=-